MEQIINILFIILSVVLVLFLPGLALSFVFLDFGKIDLIERVSLSFALSISVIPLLTFYLNLAGVKISPASVILEVIGIGVLSLVLYLLIHINYRDKLRHIFRKRG